MLPAVNNRFQNTTFNRQGDTGVFTISNPPQNFLIDPAFIEPGIFEETIRNLSLKAIIIRGEGRHFSAGADTKVLFDKKHPGHLKEKIENGKHLLNIIERSEIPVIAMIKGVCFGGGLEIALACHIRICSSGSLFAFPETGLGLVPGLGGTQRLTRLIRKSAAIRMILQGGIIDSITALECGLVDFIKDAKEIESFTHELLLSMTGNRTREVISAAMNAINNAGRLSVEQAMAEETRLFCLLANKEAERNAAGDKR